MESEQSGLGLARVIRLCFGLFAVLIMVFLGGCNRDYDPGKRRNSTFQNQPYAVPVQGRPIPQYQNPYPYRQPYYYGTPNSRSYYNPYEFQQPYGSNPYSDYDQYYIPPTQYYNNEYDNGSASTFSDKT